MATPMLEQYHELKSKYKDCILLFRLGDFYEGFYEDAKDLSKILGLTLTGRGQEDKRVPMAGIPYHALGTYLPKLINAGRKVAIAEQLEDPKPGQIVKRDVTKIITAGTIIDENVLNSNSNNYLISIYKKKTRSTFIWGLSFCDISTGEFKAVEYLTKDDKPHRDLLIEIFRLKPSEIILPREIANIFKELFPGTYLQVFEQIDYYENELREYLLKELKISSFKSIGIDKFTAGISAASKLLEYIVGNRKAKLPHINTLQEYFPFDYMNLDETTIRSLELIYPIRDGDESKTLFGVMNECLTPMGQRKLKQWLLRPLIKKEQIESRLEIVSVLYKDEELFSLINEKLSNINDYERSLARISSKSGTARDLIFIKNSLINSLAIHELVKINPILKKLLPKDSDFDDINKNVITKIEESIKEDPNILITEGDIIKNGFDKELDTLHQEYLIGKEYIKNLEIQEIKRTDINSLKVRYNQVFGYYIEISNSNISKVPDNYIRKQTLVNGERYITDELKIWEEKVLGAQEKNNQLEYKIFNRIREEILHFIPQIKEYIDFVANLDCLFNFAKIAKLNNYVKPTINEGSTSKIINSRHPVVEKIIGNDFVSNDIEFDSKGQQIIILTGPNMSGKSTFIRQVALIFLMAQMGSFVPASSADISIVDRIFTRVGASDNLASGESTFMVEMLETANILNNATDKSLIILDEVGRGTSTFDGVAIAWSIVDYISNTIKAKTLFATHYHELLFLENIHEDVKNFKVEVLEENDQVSFMHKIVRGGIDKSYGIYVAKLAGVPLKVISRSKEILSDLQKRSINKLFKSNLDSDIKQISLEDSINPKNPDNEKLTKLLKDIDVNNLSPLEVVNRLSLLQKGIKDD